MQIVIDIPEEIYERIITKTDYAYDVMRTIRAVERGKVLPKGHGRLIDADEMIADFVESKAISISERFKISNIVEHQKTILEADKEIDE